MNRQQLKFTSIRSIILIAASCFAVALLPAFAEDPPQYDVSSLDSLGGTVSRGNSINNRSWVAGYSNVMEGYIPSRRVLLEGGYEAESRPWNPTLEERIVAKVHELYGRLNPR